MSIKSVIEFFTGVTGIIAATLGLLGTVAAFALAGLAPVSEPPTTTPEVDQWVRNVDEECAGAVLIGALGAAETGDLSTFSATVGLLASELRAGPTPAGFEDAVALAADDFERSAAAAAAGDPDGAERHADSASTVLTAVGVNGC